MSLKTLKADLSLAKLKYQSKPSDATKAILEKAQKAYDEAISGEESNGSTADVKPADNKADREPAIKSISQLVLDLSAEEFAELERALHEFLRGPQNARRIPITSVSPFACPLCGRSFSAEESGDASDNSRAEEPEGSGQGEPAGEPSAEVGSNYIENAGSTEPTTEPVAAVSPALEPPAAGAQAAKPASSAKKPTGAAKGKAATEEKKTEPQS